MIWNERIKKQRELHGLTLQDAAKRLGVSESTAQRYESKKGIKNIPYDVLVKYAEILGVSPAYLMGWEDIDQSDYVVDGNLLEIKQNPDDIIKNENERLLLSAFRLMPENKQLALLRFLGLKEE